jgi:hypothetical protein
VYNAPTPRESFDRLAPSLSPWRWCCLLVVREVGEVAFLGVAHLVCQELLPGPVAHRLLGREVGAGSNGMSGFGR